MSFFKRLISVWAVRLGIITLLTGVIIFHILVLIQVIPYKIVWGGRLENDTQMIRFESISIALNLLMVGLVAIHAGYLKCSLNKRWIQVGLWAMVILFLVNTLGNMFAINDWERWVFTPLTFLLAVFSIRLAIEK